MRRCSREPLPGSAPAAASAIGIGLGVDPDLRARRHAVRSAPRSGASKHALVFRRPGCVGTPSASAGDHRSRRRAVVGAALIGILGVTTFATTARPGRRRATSSVDATEIGETIAEHTRLKRFLLERRDPQKETGLLLTIAVAVIAAADPLDRRIAADGPPQLRVRTLGRVRRTVRRGQRHVDASPR